MYSTVLHVLAAYSGSICTASCPHKLLQRFATNLVRCAADFVRVQARADGSSGEALKHLQSAQKFIKWLAINNPQEPWSPWALDRLVPHLAALRSELYKQQQRRGAVLETQALAQPEPQLASAQEMLVWGEQLKHRALAAVAAAASRPGPVSVALAQLLRDAAMITTGMGHTALMHRGSVLCTIKASSFASEPCPKGEACPAGKLCHGNRLERVAGAAPFTSASSYPSLPLPPNYQLVIPHHKTSNKAVTGPALAFSCIHACQLVQAYEDRARPVLAWIEGRRGGSAGGGGGGGGSTHALFVDDQGRPFNSESLCTWWSKAHRCVMCDL
jgi:hypothetical protein